MKCPYRVYRTFEWVLAPGQPLRIGGTNSYVLEHHDEFQIEINGKWEPVPVVEAPKPAHPSERKSRLGKSDIRTSGFEGMSEETMRALVKGVKPLKTKDK